MLTSALRILINKYEIVDGIMAIALLVV